VTTSLGYSFSGWSELSFNSGNEQQNYFNSCNNITVDIYLYVIYHITFLSKLRTHRHVGNMVLRLGISFKLNYYKCIGMSVEILYILPII